jgi:hydrogenase maturation protein HypF
MIHHGGILAMKGLGGYQLVCDARQETVVRMLRERKHRPAKPLAVMVASMAAAKELAEIDIDESNALSDVAGPIVLLRCKDQSALASSVHPGLRDVGIMLPTTTMHHLLLRRLRMPLIVTSGNMEGEPLEYDERSATARLSELADGFLHHNRPIVNPIDDSVVRIVGGRRMTIRAARGLAPCSFDLVAESSILAVGGLQKSAIAVSNGRTAMLGPHVGDLVSVRTRKRFAEHQESICRLIGSRTPTLALDAHPDTADSLHRKSTNDSASKCIQHHHAHVVAGMVEAGWLERTVLGVAFDGMGYGSDGTLWGGEFLIVSRKTFQRVGRLRPFSLLGGDVAVLQPWRIAVALLADAFGEEATLELVDQSMISCLRIDRSLATNAVRLMQRSSLSSITSSVGRLFDGVAALVCGLGKVGYEGEAAMRFEALIEGDDELRSNSTTAARRVYSFSLIQGILLEVDWRPMIREIVADLRAEVSEKNISLKFHRTIAAIVADVRERFSDLPMVLAGGVFQNRIFVESITEQLHRRSAEFFLPGDVPVNDGGLALGQLAVASSIEEVVCA